MSELKQIKRHHERQLKNMDKKLTMYQIHPDDVSWLIKQAERVEELEETNKKLIESTTVVANENHRYKLALEFYANKKNYDLKQLERDKHVIPIFEDKGKKARQALGWRELNDKHRA
jgi:hypothetical protein